MATEKIVKTLEVTVSNNLLAKLLESDADLIVLTDGWTFLRMKEINIE